MRLELANLTCRRNGRAVIDGIDLTVGPGEFVGLLGPNGAGKTTLLRAALGLLPAEGRNSLAALPAAQRARAAAFMPQGREIAWPVTVETLVALGRVAHPDAAGDADHAAVEAALAALSLQPLRHRPATQLSGGEQARALLARALAQDTPLLVADEPIAGLDPAAQIGVMRLFRGLANEGRAVLASLHDLGLAARHCSRLILLRHGRIMADGPPETVLTDENLGRCFGVTAHVAHGPQGPILQLLDTITETT
ncbi:ABC transporter ATP-binding protein [Paracoccus aminovorans]|uniref:ABC transporter ATP-binding protein n=1 Tax=Paracoccus aminovorans TaxID=34004 RepID=UPI002B25C22C|nr:ABC transporter ATP-binding protein [Paracoccus aminovorans]